MKSVAVKTGFVDRPGYHKGHAEPIPLLGGASIFMSLFITIFSGVIVAKLAAFFHVFGAMIPADLKGYLPGVEKVAGKLSAIFLGSLIVFVLGLVDDRKSLGALVKLMVQVLAGTIVFLMGLRITLFTTNIIFSYIVTIGWIVLITNAFNLLDNMDGLAGGVACVAGTIFFLLSAYNQQYFVSLLLIASIGSIAGFLLFNFYPASIFMGDAGSMLIGFIMSVGTLLGTYYYPGLPNIFAVAMPLIILGIPLYDTLSVIIIRVRTHRPIYQGDRNHFSHRLVELGMSKPGAVVFIYLVTFATGISALLLQMVEWQGVLIILVQVLIFLSIVAVLEYFGKKREKTV
jgi:UDP-GlcNAc:undecaprenyl-phosphate GlcNAc-1-phosphate transferase